MDCTYYYTFDSELAEKIFKKYRAMPYDKGNFFVFLRSDSATDEFDIYQLEYEKYHAYYNIKDFENYYLIEKYPKLRNETNYSSIIENALGGYSVLMFLREGDEQSQELTEFKAAVRRLDKKLVFCHISYISREFQQMKQDFGLADYDFRPGQVYMIYYGKKNGFLVRQMTDELKSINIVFFVHGMNKMQNEEADRELEGSGEDNAGDLTVASILEMVQKIEDSKGSLSFVALLPYLRKCLLVLTLLFWS